MAINAGDVLWNVKADISEFKKGMKEAQDGAKKLKASWGDASKKIGKAMTIAGGAITATVGASIKVWAEAGDEVQKMAQRTGFATETLSELRFAAERSGTTIQSLEKATKKMSTVIFEAGEEAKKASQSTKKNAVATGTYTDALKTLGLQYSDLQDLTPEKQFEKLAFAIADLEDHTTKAAVAQEIFGRAGTEMLPMLAQGSRGLEQLKQRARDLGLVFDQEAANKAAQFQDAMLDLKESAKSLMFVIAEAVVPTLIGAVNWITNAVQSVRQFANENPNLANTLITVTAAVGGLMLALGPLLILLPGMVQAFVLIKAGVAAMGAAMAGAGITGFGTAISVAAVALAKLVVPLILVAGVVKFTSTMVGAAIRVWSDWRAEKRRHQEQELQLAASLERLIQSYESKGIAIDRARLKGLQHNEMMAELNRQVEEGRQKTGFYDKQLTEQTETAGKNTEKTGEMTEATAEATKAQAGMQYTSAQVMGILRDLNRTLGRTENQYDDLADAANRAAKAMAKANGPGSGGAAAVPRAQGGIVNEAMTQVGERGVEIASFPKGTRITPTSKVMRALREGASQSITNNTSNRAGDMYVTVQGGAGESGMAIWRRIKGHAYRDMAQSFDRATS